MTFRVSSRKSPDQGPAVAGEERPRERMMRHGAAVLTNAELLAVVLRTGMAGHGVLALAQDLLARHDGLRGLLGATAQSLVQAPGLGTAKACQLLAIQELARRSMAEMLTREHTLDRPQLVRDYCAALIADQPVECCVALYLDVRLRLIAHEEISRGTLSQATLYPREVVRAALRHHASAVILTHNHPSGLAEPSQADVLITRRLRDALALVDVRLLDHVVVAAGQTVSMAQSGHW
jgi:DNA repair protein RadC